MPEIRNGFYDLARTHPSPNRGGRITPRAIVVHDTAGGLSDSGSIAWLSNPAAKASAHFVISREGRVTQLISCDLKAWHAGQSQLNGRANVNDFSIGIELVNPGHMQAHGERQARASFGTVYDRKVYSIAELPEQQLDPGNPWVTHPAGLWMPYPQAQLDALLDLCLAIRDVYDITEVVPHWFISPRRKVDTNPLFPLPWLRGRLAGRQDAPVAASLEINVEGFLKDGPSRPQAPTTLTVTHPVALRSWPSFNPGNEVVILEPPATVKILRDGTFSVEGEGVPKELAQMEIQWYRVSTGEVEGWLPFTCVIPEA